MVIIIPIGIGLGILSTISFATFNDYFVKRRLLMMGLAQTVVGIGFMLLPLVIVQLKDMFGFRGCLLAMAAINCNMIIAMLVMRPVKLPSFQFKPTEAEGKLECGYIQNHITTRW